MTFRTIYPTYIESLAINNSARLTSMAVVVDLYNQAANVVERPMSMDNSDETFGQQRVTTKSFALRQATMGDFTGRPLSLNDFQITRLCGLGATSLTLRLFNALFVENFSDIAQWNDPARPDKYVPNVVGFFCVHLFTKKLVPIEIRLLDTKLAYTPFDSADEWTLAKMALETASVDFHQMQHMADTHAVTIPLRVEMLRTMHTDHPVRALLLRHVFADFGLEMQVAVLLLNTSTALDKTFGGGASGSTRFLYQQTQGVGISLKEKAFYADLHARGLLHIPGHKYVTYGALYWTAIERFVGQFLDVYYATDLDVQGDQELQHWAAESAKIPHLRGVESAITTKLKLRELLTTLIFQSTVKHHAMNGAATWHGMSAPYSSAALWKPLPTRKLRSGEFLDLLAYTVPQAVLPTALALGALFLRPVPASESMYGAYKAEPLASEQLLQTPIATFENALRSIEQMIANREANEKWPYVMLCPSRLPHYTWV